MKSLDVVEFKLTLQRFIREYDLPTEVKRLVLNEILQEINLKTQREVQEEVNEREAAGNAESV